MTNDKPLKLASDQKKMNQAENPSGVNIESHDPVDVEAQATDDTQKVTPRRCIPYICMTAEERAAHDAKWAKCMYWGFPLLMLILVAKAIFYFVYF